MATENPLLLLYETYFANLHVENVEKLASYKF